MFIFKTLYKSKDIEGYGTGIPRIQTACATAGITFKYERVPIGTCFIFHRDGAFSENHEPEVRAIARLIR